MTYLHFVYLLPSLDSRLSCCHQGDLQSWRLLPEPRRHQNHQWGHLVAHYHLSAAKSASCRSDSGGHCCWNIRRTGRSLLDYKNLFPCYYSIFIFETICQNAIAHDYCSNFWGLSFLLIITDLTVQGRCGLLSAPAVGGECPLAQLDWSHGIALVVIGVLLRLLAEVDWGWAAQAVRHFNSKAFISSITSSLYCCCQWNFENVTGIGPGHSTLDCWSYSGS